MSRWKPVVGVVAVFLAGMAAGGVLVVKAVEWKTRGVIERGPEGFREVVIRNLDRRLQLRPDQRAEVARIVAESHGRIRAIHDPAHAAVAAEMEAARREIAAVLDDRQRERFDRVNRRVDRMLGSFLAPSPPGG